MSPVIRREQLLKEAESNGEWDIIVIGGGATGLGTAVEAVSRGYRTLLLEAKDFAKATSSRSTKLVHGGVRYLQQGNLKLVLEALRERGRMLRNAPQLAHRQAFVIPAYSAWSLPFYGAGLTAYDLLSGRESIGRSHILSGAKVRNLLPTVKSAGLKGGIVYYDGQFDDARYAIALLRTILDLGGIALNYVPVSALLKSNGIVCGVQAQDAESGLPMVFRAKAVINATGIFSDEVRHMDEPAAKAMLSVSQGSHIVVPREFLPGDTALMIPRTSDGRVLFAIPWHGSVVVGTTDQAVPEARYEPHSLQEERKFLAANVEQYLGRKLAAENVKSVWSGQRPLVRQPDKSSTAAISRDHTIVISTSKLITVTGGKWTTYRKMAQDGIDTAVRVLGLAPTQSVTAELRLHGWTSELPSLSNWSDVYGSDLPALKELSQTDPELNQPLHPALPFRKAEVIWAAQQEMARTVEDVLARRTRALFLNAAASIEAAPETARLLGHALGRDAQWECSQVSEFTAIAQSYLWND